MAYFPLFVNLEGKKVLIVGGGSVALRKSQVLADTGASITVITPGRPENFASATVINRKFTEDDIKGFDIVIGATDDSALNEKISLACRAQGIPVNIVDDEKKSDFIFPAVARRGDVVAGISTGGKCPALAKKIRDDVLSILPTEEEAAPVYAFREELKTAEADSGKRRERLERYINENL